MNSRFRSVENSRFWVSTRLRKCGGGIWPGPGGQRLSVATADPRSRPMSVDGQFGSRSINDGPTDVGGFVVRRSLPGDRRFPCSRSPRPNDKRGNDPIQSDGDDSIMFFFRFRLFFGRPRARGFRYDGALHVCVSAVRYPTGRFRIIRRNDRTQVGRRSGLDRPGWGEKK